MHTNKLKPAGFSYFIQARVVVCTAIALCFPVHLSANTPHSVEVLEQHFSDGDYPFIINALASAQKKTPEQYNLLISALMNQDLDDAEAAAEDFIAAYSKDYRAYHTHANVMGAQASSSIFSALGYAKKAKASLQQAIEVAPNNIKVYQALMKFHLVAPAIAGGDSERAKALVDKIASMDNTEGQFALADYLVAEGDDEGAESIYRSLSQQEDTHLRATFELGSFYLSEEKFERAVSTLMPVLDITLTKVDDKTAPEWDKYERDAFNLMYAKYRLGLAALKSGTQAETGVKALNAYLADLDTTAINTSSLPNKNWVHLRLAGLLLSLNQVDQAQETVGLITPSDNDSFNRILEKLEKQIKKRA